MALLTVLLLVAVMSAVCVLILDDIRFSVRRTTNLESGGQAQWYAAGAESLVRRQIADLTRADPARTPLEPAWNGRTIAFPIEEGEIRVSLRDGQACFNLNSLVVGQGEDLIADPDQQAQFIALGAVLGLSRTRMNAVSAALTDWLDADAEPLPNGAEDARYASLATPYRTGGVMLGDVSEIRAVAGMDDALYQRLRPYVCVLPNTRQSININALSLEGAPLLEMMGEGEISRATARAAIAARPQAGWASADAFWDQPAFRGFVPNERIRGQAVVATRFFDVRIDVEQGGAHAVRTALIQAAPDGAARTVIRRWIPEE